MNILFYSLDKVREDRCTLAPELSLRVWRPSDGLPTPGPQRLQNLAWLALDRSGLFARPGFEELSIWRGEEMLQRLIVTPRWARFPFMAADDLQIGALWTHPAARRQGLARTAMTEAHRRLAKPAGRVWYVADAANTASIRLAEACGYRLVGEGRRTRPFGVAAIGRFEIDRAQRSPTIRTQAIAPVRS